MARVLIHGGFKRGPHRMYGKTNRGAQRKNCMSGDRYQRWPASRDTMLNRWGLKGNKLAGGIPLKQWC